MNRGLFGVCTLGFVAVTPGCEYISPLFDLKGDDDTGWQATTAPGTMACCTTTGTTGTWTGTGGWSTGTGTGTGTGSPGTWFDVDVTWSEATPTGTAPIDTGTVDTGAPPAPSCSSQVDILVHESYGAPNFDFGMVDASSTGGWTGEDCISVPSLCHSIAPQHTLHTTTDCDRASAVAGSTTGFGLGDEPFLTYYLEDGSVGYCWVWGADPSYYASLGCQQL